MRKQHSWKRWHPSRAIYLAIQISCIHMHAYWHWCAIIYTHYLPFPARYMHVRYIYIYIYMICVCVVYSSLYLYSSSELQLCRCFERPEWVQLRQVRLSRYYGHCCSHRCQSGFASFEQERWAHIFPEDSDGNSRERLKHFLDLRVWFCCRWWVFRNGTLPKTNSSPLKIGHPKRKLVFQPSIFRCHVSFREGRSLYSMAQYGCYFQKPLWSFRSANSFLESSHNFQKISIYRWVQWTPFPPKKRWARVCFLYVFFGWLVGWLVGGWVGWLVGWLVGWF